MIWTCGGLLVMRYDRGAHIFQISSSPFKIFGVKDCDVNQLMYWGSTVQNVAAWGVRYLCTLVV